MLKSSLDISSEWHPLAEGPSESAAPTKKRSGARVTRRSRP